MAETKGFKLGLDNTWTLGDGTRTYAIRVEPGNYPAETRVKRTLVRQHATTGALDGQPRYGPVTEPATIAFGKVRVNDPGMNTTEATMSDIVYLTGYVLSTWTTTETGSEPRCYTLTRASAARSGAETGVSRVWTDVHIDPETIAESVADDGHFLAFTLTCNTDPVDTRVT